jgi:hypothetical protein
MVLNSPDEHGPYAAYFESWFKVMKKARDYDSRRICFKNLYFMPNPGLPWFWNDWGRISDCSLVGPSPLYQSFNVYLLKKWQQAYGALQNPNDVFENNNAANTVHVVIEVRAINKFKRDGNSVARHIANLQDLISSIQDKVPNIRVTAQDFAKLNFKEQVALAHTAGVLISMHGAGTTHIFHMAVGKPNCCALVELQPDHSRGFQDAWGYANLPRMLGFHYYRAEGRDGSTGPKGTTVDVVAITEMVRDAVSKVRHEPTCLHEVRY